MFEGFLQHTLFGLDLMLELSCKPDLDALSDMLDGIGKDNLCVIIVLSRY